MKRTKHKHPDAILCADMHLREDHPTCRTDNYWETQWIKAGFIRRLQEEYDCPVLHAGDLFHHWKPSPHLLSETMKYLPTDFWTVYGQHDLPQHNLELAYKCGINTLQAANRLHIFPGGHWNRDPSQGTNWTIKNRDIFVWHTMTYQGKKLWPGQTDPPASKLLRKYPQFDLIVTGDNHLPFVEEYEGRLLVNPGSMMRMTADQIDHRPRVYLWYADTNTVEPIYLPIEKDVVSREHIERQEQRNERIDAFVSRLGEDWEVELDFEENLHRFAEKNKVRQSVMDIVYKAIES